METSDHDEISVRELLQTIWQQRLMIVLVTITVTAVVALVAWMLPDKYTATVVFSPVSNNSAGSRLGGLASQMGGLAAIAGISVGDDSNKAESIAILQSRSLGQRYITENDLMPVLFADRWDQDNKKWLGAEDRQPTLWKANEEFRKICNVVEEKKSGVLTLSVTWTNPQLAAKWANGLVQLANDYQREKAIIESEQHIEYLKDQGAATDVPQLRAAIYSVLESEVKKVMLAKGPGDFALKGLDPAVAPERVTSPKRMLLVLAAFFAGVLFSLLLVFLRATWKSGSATAPV